MDYQLFTVINSIALNYALMDAAGIFFAVYALPLFAILVFILGIRRPALIGYACIGAGLAYIANWLLGLLFVRSRPFVDHVVNQLINKPSTSKSFPSDHAALAFALAGTLTFYYPKMIWIWFICAFIIALSRIYVGVHYPFDVIAGACVGSMSALAVRFFADKKLGRI